MPDDPLADDVPVVGDPTLIGGAKADASVPPDRPGSPLTGSDLDTAPIPRRTPLDSLAATLAAEVETEPLTLEVPTRARTWVRFSGAPIAWDQVMEWRKKASRKDLRTAGNPEGVHLARYAAIVIANTAEAILHQAPGEDDRVEVLDPAGAPLNFRNPTLWRMLPQRPRAGVGEVIYPGSAADAVFAFYGLDGHVQNAGTKVLDRAGYGDEIPEADDDEDRPTSPRS